LKQLGASHCSLSLEDDKANMAAILSRQLPLTPCATVYSPIALLTSRIPLRALRTGSTISADSGEEIILDDTDGLTVARSAHAFSLLGHLHELTQLGCGEFIIDLSQVGLVSPQGQRVLTAATGDQTLEGTSLFNFARGLA
jgi:putative protease